MSGIHEAYVVNDQAPQFCRYAQAVLMGANSFACCLQHRSSLQISESA